VPEYNQCAEAVTCLADTSNIVYVCAQVIIESYVVLSRPVEVNGLGYTVPETRQFLLDVEESFPCLQEPLDIGKQWSSLMMKYSVIGKQAHDARIVALMLAHGVTRILTLNPNDFTRYSGIVAITPQEIILQG
jgi:predicted nucleic acid-binding protein